jgi:hypothetical protein
MSFDRMIMTLPTGKLAIESLQLTPRKHTIEARMMPAKPKASWRLLIPVNAKEAYFKSMSAILDKNNMMLKRIHSQTRKRV